MRICLSLIASLLLLSTQPCFPYPIDGYEATGIGRLEGQRRIQAGEIEGRKQPSGGMLPTEQINLRLLSHPKLDLPAPDPEFTQTIVSLLGDRAGDYQFAVLDISDPESPRLAVHQPHARNNVGSVGKLIVALGVFQALADIYPDDTDARRKVLHDARITADALVKGDHHDVPIWNPETREVVKRPLAPGDMGNFWEYLDWALSASSNAAASMVIKNLMLLKHFGDAYPLPPGEGDKFVAATRKAELGQLLVDAMQVPLTRNGFDLTQIRQGSFFTGEGNRLVPATTSYATPETLLVYLLRLEQGRLVDEFSSREIKRLMYSTEKRIRYASSPALSRSAVYFKSGSLYQCKAEVGFRCLKYRGNVKNYMNSVAIVESTVDEKEFHYLVALTSNVLRRNSAVDHQTLATGIHELITTGKVSSAATLARTEEELARAGALAIEE